MTPERGRFNTVTGGGGLILTSPRLPWHWGDENWLTALYYLFSPNSGQSSLLRPGSPLSIRGLGGSGSGRSGRGALAAACRAKFGPCDFLPCGTAGWFFLSPVADNAKAGPEGAAGRRDRGDRAGDTQQRGPSPPSQLWLCAALGRSPGSCSAAPQPSPGGSSPSQSVAKQSPFCSERCLRFFHASQAFSLETPVPESSGYVKTCLHLKQKSVPQPCDPRGKFVTTCPGAGLPGVAQPAWEHLQLQGSVCRWEFGACLVLIPLSASQ